MADNHRQKLTVKATLHGKPVYENAFESFPIVLGRGSQCHISIPLNPLARTHAVFTVQGHELKVTDLDGEVGIRFNNTVATDFTITHRGEFSIGDIHFHLELKALDSLVDQDENRFVIHTPKGAAQVSHHARIAEMPMPPSMGASGVAPSPVPPLSRPSLKSRPMPPLPVVDSEPEEVSAIRKTFTIGPVREVLNLGINKVSLQAIISWDSDIFDVVNFWQGEKLIFGPQIEDVGYLPIFKKSFILGRFSSKGAILSIPETLTWRLYRKNEIVEEQELQNENRINERRSLKRLTLNLNEVISIDLSYGLRIHLRYVDVPRPFIRRDWIENKEEFQKAIAFSSMMHLVASLFSMYVAPKSSAPEIDNVPPRFAKLLVEPPPQVLAPPPPPPEPPKVEEKVVKPEPPKPKPVVKTDKPIRKAVVPKPVKPVAETPKPMEKVIEAVPDEQAQAEEMAALFNNLPGGKGGAKNNLNKNFKIDSKTSTTTKGMAVGSMFNSLSKTGSGGNSITAGPGAMNSKMGQIKSGLAQANVGSKVGQRGVSGGVVGTPSFQGVTGPQGLSNEEIMKVVQAKISEIHRCYERALFENPDIKGRVEYQWTISTQGAVGDAQVIRSEVSNGDFLNRCVLDVIKKMRFPKSTKNLPTTANIGFPFGRE